jgi:type III secretion protein T
VNPLPDSQLLWSFFAPVLAALPRVSAAIIVAPLFPTNLFPVLLRSAIAVSLSLYLYPHMAADMPAAVPPLLWIALIGKEAFIGALLGFAVGSLVWAFECVGAVIDFQVGFANAQIFDPFGGHEAGPLGQLMMRLGAILFVAGGGLQVLASLLFESFHLWPAASFYPSTGRLADFAGGSVKSLAELIVRLAAPAVLVLALIDLGFALVSRVVPQLNVFFFTMPIKGVLAALMIALYLSYLSDVAAEQLSGLKNWLERLGPVLSAP